MPAPEAAVRTEILVVDDDEQLARSVGDLLQRHGYVVGLAHHGRAAMDFLIRQRVSLVISDIFMPEADGLELLALLRRCVPRPPLVAMSGSSTYRVNGMLRTATMLGAVRSISKPFSSAQMIKLVEELIGPPARAIRRADSRDPVAP